MKSRLLGAALAAATSFAFANIAQASTVYTYTGPNFDASHIIDLDPPGGAYTSAMNIIGSFTVAGPLINQSGDITAQVLSFSFFDGRSALTNLNVDPASDQFIFTTDATGKVLSGFVFITTNNNPFQAIGDQRLLIFISPGNDEAQIAVCTAANQFGCQQIGFDDAQTSDATGEVRRTGTWSDPVSANTPLPAALPLFVTGLGAFGLLGWRRKKKCAIGAIGENSLTLQRIVLANSLRMVNRGLSLSLVAVCRAPKERNNATTAACARACGQMAGTWARF